MRYTRQVCLLLVFVLFSLVPSTIYPQQKTYLRMMSGQMGGSWWPIGGAISELIQKSIPDINVSLLPGAGVSNVIAIEQGKADIGLGMSSTTIDGLTGNEPFKTPTKNVLHLINLFPMLLQMVVMDDSGIKSVADMRGKRICPSPKGMTSELITKQVLQIYGISYSDMSKVHFVNYSDGIELMKDGHSDIYSFTTPVPSSALLDLSHVRKIRLIPLPDDKIKELQKLNATYTKKIIPAKTYLGVDYNVQTISIFTHVIVSSKLSEPLAYKITKVIAENANRLADVVQDMKGIQPKDLATDVGVPFHPGALKYYREVGAMK